MKIASSKLQQTYSPNLNFQSSNPPVESDSRFDIQDTVEISNAALRSAGDGQILPPVTPPIDVQVSIFRAGKMNILFDSSLQINQNANTSASQQSAVQQSLPVSRFDVQDSIEISSAALQFVADGQPLPPVNPPIDV